MKPVPVVLSGGAAKSDLPFSPAMIAGNLVFISGQVGWDPDTREVEPSIEKQTAQTFENIKSILDAAGTSLDYAVKVSVFLRNIEDFAKMNDVYRTYFSDTPPARTTVGVQLAREDLLIEIDLVAALPEADA